MRSARYAEWCPRAPLAFNAIVIWQGLGENDLALDSSALIKLVVEEAESAALRRWLHARPDGTWYTSALVEVEVLRAVGRARPNALDDRLVDNDPRASSLLYHVWPEIDRNRPTAWLTYVEGELFGWQCTAAKVNQTLQAEGRVDRVSVVPGGIALTELVRRALAGAVPGVTGTAAQRIDAVFADDVHLRPLGIYLMAAGHYAALFGRARWAQRVPPGWTLRRCPCCNRSRGTRYPATTPAPGARIPRFPSAERASRASCGPAYYRFTGRPEQVPECNFWTTSDSPFAGPDPARVPALTGWGSACAVLLLVGLGYCSRRHRP